MFRLAASLFAVVFVFGVASAEAEEIHREWMKYLEGEWKFVWPEREHSGTATYTMAAEGHALVARHQSNEGSSVELIGWQPDAKAMIFSGFGSGGNYWHAEYDKVSMSEISGEVVGIMLDGRAIKGTVTIKRVSDDKFEGRLKGTADGEEVSDVAKFTRKKT